MKIAKKAIRVLLPRRASDMLRSVFFTIRTSPIAASLGRTKLTPEWETRIKDTIACKDNADIPRHESAGRLQGKWITMHNGVIVSAMGYYGSYMMNLLIRNRGVHEPQEEKAFELLIPHLPEDATMLELGAYWAFYSLSFKKGSSRRKCYMVEPGQRNILCGQSNFKKNGHEGNFTRAYVGALPSVAKDGIPVISVDDFCMRESIDYLHILHADIQSFELDMLHGAEQMVMKRKIGLFFISTHSEELHRSCMDFLISRGIHIICDASPIESYSEDGVIVAKTPGTPGPELIQIDKKLPQ